MREVQQELPHLGPYGDSASTSRGPGPLTLSRRMHEALNEGLLPIIRSIEAQPRFNADRTYSKYGIDLDGKAVRSRYTPYRLPLESRVHLSLRLRMPQVFHNGVLLDIIQKRDTEMLKLYMSRPHLRDRDIRSVGAWIGRTQPLGAQLWLAKSGMPTLYLMTGAMENANCGVLLTLIDHLEQNPPANPHEIGLWLKANPMPGFWSGSRAIEKRLSVMQFRPAPAVAKPVFTGRPDDGYARSESPPKDSNFKLPTESMTM